MIWNLLIGLGGGFDPNVQLTVSVIYVDLLEEKGGNRI